MASVNFMKCKSTTEAKAMLRHCDKEERLKHEHSNKQINKDLTENNISFTKLGYKDVCKKYDDRIKFLDETTNTNKRKDRVSMFGLTIPVPENMSKEDSQTFFFDTIKLLGAKFGKENLIGAYAHYDEIHDYIEPKTKEVKTSREHLHVYVVPEIQGKLNGKKFSSKASMQALNRAIDKLCKDKYHCNFLTGQEPQRLTVEQLKELSNKAITEQLAKKNSLNKELTELSTVRETALKETQTAIAERDKAKEQLAELRGKILTEEQAKAITVKKNLLNRGYVQIKYEDWQNAKTTLSRISEVDTREHNLDIREHNLDERYRQLDANLEQAIQDFIQDRAEDIVDKQINNVGYQEQCKHMTEFIRTQNLQKEFTKFMTKVRAKAITKAKETITKNFNRYNDEYDR